MSLKYLSKTVAFILRHHPEQYGIALDEHGWANVDDLIDAIAEKQRFTRDMLEEVTPPEVLYHGTGE